MIAKLTIIDFNSTMVEECAHAFSDYDNVELIEGDFFSAPADMLVSPANSFGFMDGGLDLAIRNHLGTSLEVNVRNVIQTDFAGELPIGSSIIVKTLNKNWPYLGVAPTMRVPSNINGTLNVYYAFRSMMLEIIKFNKKRRTPIKSVVFPGMGTGIGGMSERKSAMQMAFAYKQLLEREQQKTAKQILQENNELELLR
ncbi:macro domain-containing protein [Aliikangiella sp. IMCC44359]|uniref:macro domain-containing protein n=1 Tax=Aliikangiella sp. IMCC44359 TaxID=3459125 RepID=UPI00403B33C5